MRFWQYGLLDHHRPSRFARKTRSMQTTEYCMPTGANSSRDLYCPPSRSNVYMTEINAARKKQQASEHRWVSTLVSSVCHLPATLERLPIPKLLGGRRLTMFSVPDPSVSSPAPDASVSGPNFPPAIPHRLGLSSLGDGVFLPTGCPASLRSSCFWKHDHLFAQPGRTIPPKSPAPGSPRTAHTQHAT